MTERTYTAGPLGLVLHGGDDLLAASVVVRVAGRDVGVGVGWTSGDSGPRGWGLTRRPSLGRAVHLGRLHLTVIWRMA